MKTCFVVLTIFKKTQANTIQNCFLQPNCPTVPTKILNVHLWSDDSSNKREKMKNSILRMVGKEDRVEKKRCMQQARGGKARTRHLPAQGGSHLPHATGLVQTKQAFSQLQIGQGDCVTPLVACFSGSHCEFFFSVRVS